MWPSGGKARKINKQEEGRERERNNRRKASGASASPPLSLSIPHIERDTHTHNTHSVLVFCLGAASLPALNST